MNNSLLLKNLNKKFTNFFFFLILKPTFVDKATHYYIWGIREKYVVLNIRSVVENIIKIKLFVSFAKKLKNKFCFVSFNPVFKNLAKMLANCTNNSYIVGNWSSGFFSRKLPFSLLKTLHKNETEIKLIRKNMPIFIFLSTVNSFKFIFETSFLNQPTISFINFSDKNNLFTYSIVNDTISVESIFFYSKLITMFFSNEKFN